MNIYTYTRIFTLEHNFTPPVHSGRTRRTAWMKMIAHLLLFYVLSRWTKTNLKSSILSVFYLHESKRFYRSSIIPVNPLIVKLRSWNHASEINAFGMVSKLIYVSRNRFNDGKRARKGYSVDQAVCIFGGFMCLCVYL